MYDTTISFAKRLQNCGSSEHLRSIHQSLSVVHLAGGGPISSACLYVQAKTEYNVLTKNIGGKNQLSKEKYQAKNGFNFGDSFRCQFKTHKKDGHVEEARSSFTKVQ